MAPRKWRESELVALAAAGVGLGGAVEQLVAQAARRARGRPRRAASTRSLEVGCAPRRSRRRPPALAPGEQRGEVAVVGGEVGALLDAGLDLAAGGHVALARARRAGWPSSCSRAAGTLVMRVAMTPQSSFVAVGMRSKTSRTSCSGEAMTLSAISSSPARVGLLGEARGARVIAAMVTRSTSSAGVALVERGQGARRAARRGPRGRRGRSRRAPPRGRECRGRSP